MIRSDMTMDYYAGARDMLKQLDGGLPPSTYRYYLRVITVYEAAVLEAMAQASQAQAERSVDGKKEDNK